MQDQHLPVFEPSMAEGAAASSGWRSLWPASLREAALAMALAVAYAICAVISLRWAVAPGVGTAFWPAAGLALAALVVAGPRLWIGVVLGRLLAFWAVAAPQPLWSQLIIALATALGALLPALAINVLRTDSRLESLRSALWLVLGAAGGGASVSAGAGLLVLLIGGAEPGRAAHAFVNWWFGFATGVLTFAPLLLAWRDPPGWPLRQWAHFLVVCGLTAVLAWAIFLGDMVQPAARAWFVFPFMVWAALAFDARGAALTTLVVSLCAFAATVQGGGPFPAEGSSSAILLTQQFVGVLAATATILAGVAHERRGREALMRSEQRYRDESDALSIINETGAAIAAELDLDRAIQHVTEAGLALTRARYGAFFYRADDQAEFRLHTLAGAPKSTFEALGHPRATAVFKPTFEGEAVVRADDITHDPRFGHSAPHHGMPVGHPAIRSYLAAPVRSRSGELLGALLFGHPEAGVFDARAERLAVGIAAHAAIALDNARLYQSLQIELQQRRQAQGHQRLLINELNHRVKNTLATVQSLGAQTLRSAGSLGEAREAFEQRLMALSATHDLLTRSSWESADLRDLVAQTATLFDRERIHQTGPSLPLAPSQALALSMALHELATNALKYGALSTPSGEVSIRWTLEGPKVRLAWREEGGPAVSTPLRKGFGARLIAEALARELRGEVRLDYPASGACCDISFPVAADALEPREISSAAPSPPPSPSPSS